MYYIKNNDKIIPFYTNDRKSVVNTLKYMPQYKDLEILKTNKEIIKFNNEYVFKEDVEEELKEQERQRLDNFFLTRADVERAIYKVKGMDFDDIVELIKDNSAIDLKALKIELKANNFYRGNPYISQIGSLLGFSEVQMDEFFKTGDYTKLISQQE